MSPREVLIVAPVPGRPGYFRASLDDGAVLVASSRVPFCDAARQLIELGHDPSAVLVMKDQGSEAEVLRASIGKAAGLTVEEGDGRRPPRFVKWRPYVVEGSARTAIEHQASVGHPELPEAAE